MYKYRITGLVLLLIVILFDYFTFYKTLIAFNSYDFYSIGFIFLMYLYPLEMILLNDIPFLFRSREKVIEKRWRLIVDGKSFYKSPLIKYLDYTIIFLISISLLIMVVGGV